MNFGEAIAALKEGKLVRRAGWNGKGMHLYLEDWLEGVMSFGADNRRYQPVIVMYTAAKEHQPGWLASQADMLADDWQEVAQTRRCHVMHATSKPLCTSCGNAEAAVYYGANERLCSNCYNEPPKEITMYGAIGAKGWWWNSSAGGKGVVYVRKDLTERKSL